jgi:hypothetical protein
MNASPGLTFPFGYPAASDRKRPFLNIVRGSLFFLVLYGVAFLSLWVSWDIANWTLFWCVTIGYLVLLPIGYGFFSTYTRSSLFSLPITPLLREVLANSAERLAPADAIQPLPLSEESDTIYTPKDQFEHLHTSPSPMMPLGCLFALFVVLFFIVFLTTSISSSSSSVFNGQVVIFLLVFFAPTVPVAVILGFMGMRRVRRNRHAVKIDDFGISWHEGRQWKQISWGEVRAFVHFSPSVVPQTSNTTYLVVSATDFFAWAFSESANVAAVMETDYVSRVIVARAHVPLRDATRFMSEIGTLGVHLPALIRSRGLEKGVSPELLLSPVPSSSPSLWRRAGGFALIALTLAPFAVGGYAQYYHDGDVSSFAQQIDKETPLFRDSLAQPDGLWPIIALSAQNSSGYGYVDGMYELHGTLPGQTEIATADRASTAGSAAYAVTAVQTGAVPQNEYDGIGLVAHVDPAFSEYLVFFVHYDGSWELDRYHEYGLNDPDNWEYLDGGTSGAIHQGAGAANRLMMVTYPDGVYLMVNGQLLDHYVPSSYDRVNLSLQGAAGVILNSSAMTGDFTDFVIAPAPSTSFWAALQAWKPGW